MSSDAPTRPNLVKTASEERVKKANQKQQIKEDEIYLTLDKTVCPCFNRDLIGEVERMRWRSLPNDHWARALVFEGASLKRADRQPETLEDVLATKFGMVREIRLT